MQVRKAKEATSEINEESQQEEEVVFPVKFTKQFWVNRSVVDSNHCTRSCCILEKHSTITCCKVTNWVAGFIFERQNTWNNGMRTGGIF